MSHAQTLVNQLPQDSVVAVVAKGCLLFKEEKFEEAKVKF